MLLLRGAREPVRSVQFSPDGRGLAAPCAGGVQLWSGLAAGARPTSVLAYRDVVSARFTPGGGMLLVVAGIERPGLALHDLSTGEAVAVPSTAHAFFRFCEQMPDGR